MENMIVKNLLYGIIEIYIAVIESYEKIKYYLEIIFPNSIKFGLSSTHLF